MSIDTNKKRAEELVRQSLESEHRIAHQSEMGEALFELNRDGTTQGRKDIDLRTNLNQWQIQNILIYDYLGQRGMIPGGTDLTDQLKRTSVSLNGIGRRQIVELTGRTRDERANMGGGIIPKMRNLFGGKEE